MLIKLQRTRFSAEYMVIENARNVTYRDEPLIYSEHDILPAMYEFINRPQNGTPSRMSCWYQIDNDDREGFVPDFGEGYAINEISFTNPEGVWECIRFDGQAFVCNDEGKTIHRIKAGGCPSVFRGMPDLTDSQRAAGEEALQQLSPHEKAVLLKGTFFPATPADLCVESSDEVLVRHLGRKSGK